MKSDIQNLVAAIHNLNDEFSKNQKYTSFLPYDAEKNARLCDIESEAHLFLIACLMDRQITAEKAWNIPFALEQRIGRFTMQSLSEMGEADIIQAMKEPALLHRLWKVQSIYLMKMSHQVVAKYGGMANKIWSGCPKSAEIVWRFLEFEGIGPKIATMATNILVRDLKVKVSDKSSIDVSVDTHVGRLFTRLGLSESRDRDAIVYRARDLCPDYPGVLDLPLWVIGREYCHAGRPPSCLKNNDCPLYEYCPKKI